MDMDSAVHTFLLSRQAIGCSPATMRIYRDNLLRFARQVSDPSEEALSSYLLHLRKTLKPISVHQHYRTLRTFFRWCLKTGRISSDPLEGFRMRTPMTLPNPPTDEDVARLLAACDTSLVGRRNKAMIALFADSGLRREELRHLRVGDVDLTTRTIRVTLGKGGRERVGFFGEVTASILRSWLSIHPDPRPQAFLFVTKEGVQVGSSRVGHILRALSKKAGLGRRVSPHALRHYAATSLMKRTGDLELVRRVLGHSTLAMALRYARLTQTDILRKFTVASPVDHIQR